MKTIQSDEEGQRVYYAKHCDENNKNEDASLEESLSSNRRYLSMMWQKIEKYIIM